MKWEMLLGGWEAKAGRNLFLLLGLELDVVLNFY